MASYLVEVSHLLRLPHEDEDPLPHHREAQSVEQDVSARDLCTIEDSEVEVPLLLGDDLRQEELGEAVDIEGFVPR